MATATPQRISIGQETLTEARETGRADLQASTLILRHPDGHEQALPAHLQEVLLRTLQALAGSGEVTIGKVPNELTSTAAADVLGVSRPTLMKWVQDEKIDSHKIGSHTRFKREDVLELKRQRLQEQKDAFARLRALDAELDLNFDD